MLCCVHDCTRKGKKRSTAKAALNFVHSFYLSKHIFFYDLGVLSCFVFLIYSEFFLLVFLAKSNWTRKSNGPNLYYKFQTHFDTDQTEKELKETLLRLYAVS